MTAYQPGGRLGVLDILDDGTLDSFVEKPQESGTWINAGFSFVSLSFLIC